MVVWSPFRFNSGREMANRFVDGAADNRFFP